MLDKERLQPEPLLQVLAQRLYSYRLRSVMPGIDRVHAPLFRIEIGVVWSFSGDIRIAADGRGAVYPASSASGQNAHLFHRFRAGCNYRRIAVQQRRQFRDQIISGDTALRPDSYGNAFEFGKQTTWLQ